jgi:hypothetical protein
MKEMNGPARFRQLLAKPDYIMAMGIWDPLSARVCESMGLQCVHIGGYQAGVGTCISEPLMTLTELASLCHYVTAAVKIPVFVDAGTGFGEPLHVMRTVKELERTGIAGLHIEDQIFPKRAHYHQGVEHVVSRAEMVDKIKADGFDGDGWFCRGRGAGQPVSGGGRRNGHDISEHGRRSPPGTQRDQWPMRACRQRRQPARTSHLLDPGISGHGLQDGDLSDAIALPGRSGDEARPRKLLDYRRERTARG